MCVRLFTWTPLLPQSAQLLLLCRENSFPSTQKVEVSSMDGKKLRTVQQACVWTMTDTL
jgi:hypothetical protein